MYRVSRRVRKTVQVSMLTSVMALCFVALGWIIYQYAKYDNSSAIPVVGILFYAIIMALAMIINQR